DAVFSYAPWNVSNYTIAAYDGAVFRDGELLAVFSSQAVPQSTTPDNDTARRHRVMPAKTDPAITGPADGSGSYVHFAEAPTGNVCGKLFVFLPGTGAPPAVYLKVQSVAVQSGFHAIGLVYRNDESARTLCASGPDDCQELFRKEVITGEDV